MSARDELQRDVLEALADDATLLTITVDFARGVLAEMDSGRDELEATRGYAGEMARKAEAAQFDIEDADQRRDDWKSRWQEAVRHADEAFAERDAAQATLAEVRELLKSSVPIMLPADAIDFHRRLHEILDRSTP